MADTYNNIGIQIPKFFLPVAGINLNRWAVIACDQFTSEPEYWKQVEDIVADSPSTLNLLLPEVYLNTEEETKRIEHAQKKMKEYLDTNILKPYQGIMLVERHASGKKRHGLMLALDLECYDFNKGSQTLIRATEGTIIERLPPRIKIRNGASLELPHILVLIDDPDQTVIEPLIRIKQQMNCLYDFELMLDSGHVKGYFSDQKGIKQQVINALTNLASPDVFYQKYAVEKENGILLFAMGDGNHSLATAKAFWEQIKPTVGINHPARYALVEIENLHDKGLEFEPIHRVIFNVRHNLQNALEEYFHHRIRYVAGLTESQMFDMIQNQPQKDHLIGVITEFDCGVIHVSQPLSNLPVGTLQSFLDNWKTKDGFDSIDYVHGQSVVSRLGRTSGNVGFLLPAMDKNELFKTVIVDGALPRKTFSMGEAKDKRFYIESRMIIHDNDVS